MLAGERPLRGVEKNGQQGIFAFGQRDCDAAGIGQAPQAPVQLPAAKLASAPLGIALRRGAASFTAPQNGADASQEFPQAERFRQIVVGAEFQPDDSVDLIAAIAGHDDYRDIRARPDLPQQVEPIRGVKPPIEDDEIRLARSKMANHLLLPRRGNGAHIVLLKVVADHMPHDPIVLNDADARRTIVGRAQGRRGLVESCGPFTACPVDIRGDLSIG
jgi:hypothetical protein